MKRTLLVGRFSLAGGGPTALDIGVQALIVHKHQNSASERLGLKIVTGIRSVCTTFRFSVSDAATRCAAPAQLVTKADEKADADYVFRS